MGSGIISGSRITLGSGIISGAVQLGFAIPLSNAHTDDLASYVGRAREIAKATTMQRLYGAEVAAKDTGGTLKGVQV